LLRKPVRNARISPTHAHHTHSTNTMTTPTTSTMEEGCGPAPPKAATATEIIREHAPKLVFYKRIITLLVGVVVLLGVLTGVATMRAIEVAHDTDDETSSSSAHAPDRTYAALANVPYLSASLLDRVTRARFATARGLESTEVTGYAVSGEAVTLATHDPTTAIVVRAEGAVVRETLDAATGAFADRPIVAFAYADDVTAPIVEVATAGPIELAPEAIWRELRLAAEKQQQLHASNGTAYGVGSAVFGDVDLDVRFAKFADGRVYVSLETPTRLLVVHDDVLFTYEPPQFASDDYTLIACEDRAANLDAMTDIAAGRVDKGHLTYHVDVVHEGQDVPEAFVRGLGPVPDPSECAAIYFAKVEAFYTAKALASTASTTAANETDGRRLVVDDGTASEKPVSADHARMMWYHDLLQQIERTGAHDDHGRRLSTTESQWALDAYGSGPNIVADGNAQFLYPAPCVFAFAGSDDVEDWVSNAQIVPANENGKQVHTGFLAEFNSLKDEINARCNCYATTCTFVGHSLGGAIADVARLHYGRGAVTTFGKPQVFWQDYGCFVGGTRVYHESDPVAGNLFGILGLFWHASGSDEIYENCRWNWCTCGWFCGYPCYQCSGPRIRSRGCTDNSGSFDTNFDYHSMANIYNVYTP